MKITGTSDETNIHFTSYIAQLLLEWEMFQANIIQKIETGYFRLGYVGSGGVRWGGVGSGRVG